MRRVMLIAVIVVLVAPAIEGPEDITDSEPSVQRASCEFGDC
jgi:hypothetical protein